MVLPVGVSDVRDAAGLARSGWRRLAGWARADHQTILTRRGVGTGHYRDGFFTGVAVAPSRRIMPLAPDELVERAIALVAAGWPDQLDGTIASSGADLIRFEARDREGGLLLVVEVRSTGLVETMTRVSPHEADGEVVLDLVEVLRPVATLHRAVGLAPMYQGWRHRHSDWYFGLSTTHARLENPVSWAGLILPGLADPPRANHAFPVSPVPGFAADSLRGWTRRKPVTQIMALMASDLLVQNGYIRVANAAEKAARLALGDPEL